MARTNDRGYGADHKRLRAKIKAEMDDGVAQYCWRCGKPIEGDFDLGHDDDDRSKYMGPEHPACNRATKTHKAAIVVDDSRVW